MIFPRPMHRMRWRAHLWHKYSLGIGGVGDSHNFYWHSSPRAPHYKEALYHDWAKENSAKLQFENA